MASVSFVGGAAESTGSYIQWQNRDAPVGLVNASALSPDADPRYVQRVRFWKSVRADKLYVNAKRTAPDGSSAFGSGDDLSSDWEESATAVIVSAGGQMWMFSGPDHPDAESTDTTEPYGWSPGTAAVNSFIAAYEALTQAERDATVITLDDGQGVPRADHSVTPSTATLTVSTPMLSVDHQVAPSMTTDHEVMLTDAHLAVQARALPRTFSGGLHPAPARLNVRTPGVAFVQHVSSAPQSIERWILSLRLPWDQLERRWKLTLAQARVAQRLVEAGHTAMREWSPLTCRPQTLQAWGRVLKRPQRPGETAAAYRDRLVRYRSEAVGTSGWILDEVRRITGDAMGSERVIEFPRQGLKWGYSRWGSARWGAGPNLIVGVEPEQRADLQECLEAGVPPDVGISYVDPAVFDSI